MSKLIAIGELLVDFIPLQKGRKIKDVVSFEKVAGGAPANVAACVAKLGEKSVIITKLGKDPFGDFLVETLQNINVDITHIKRTEEAKTALAFVSLSENGERDFSFYRNPSADMLLSPNEIDELLFEPNDILHFCSVDLVDWPVRQAHKKAIEYAIKNNCIISFDPNLRFSLWDNLDEYKKTVNEFIPYTHIIKVSDEELEFITGTNDTEKGVEKLFVGNVQIVILTKGSNGAEVYSRDKMIFVPSFKVKALDTTGAGDSFIGSILYQLIHNKLQLIDILNEEVIKLAHLVSAYVISHYGAIPSMPIISDLIQYKNGTFKN